MIATAGAQGSGWAGEGWHFMHVHDGMTAGVGAELLLMFAV